MSIKSLEDLFMHELRRAHAAETSIIAQLPRLAADVGPPLQNADVDAYLVHARERIRTLERHFKLEGAAPAGVSSPGVAGILAEADQLFDSIETADARSAAMRAEIQTVRSYVHSRYSALASWARILGKTREAECLEATLQAGETHDSAGAPQNATFAIRAEKAPAKGISMGERLTTLFDRKS